MIPWNGYLEAFDGRGPGSDARAYRAYQTGLRLDIEIGAAVQLTERSALCLLT